MLGSGLLEFKFDYWESRNLAIGDGIISEDFSAGGHLWRISCYPWGDRVDNNGEYISIFLRLISNSKDVKTVFHVFCVGRDYEPSFHNEKRLVRVYSQDPDGPDELGWAQFMRRSVLESYYVTNGWVTFLCNVIVLGGESGDTIAVPPSNIGCHLSLLLDSSVGTDVSFIVKGEVIPAHRAVLAARSPVFKAELFGAMADATSPSITLHDIEPVTFKAMLAFMYTDELPGDQELGDSPTDMMKHLLAAADRYALDRLKLMCARKLWDNISVGTFASTLACAETYNCPELKSKCIDFFAVEKNLKKIIFTEGFMWLVQKFPSLAATLKERIEA